MVRKSTVTSLANVSKSLKCTCRRGGAETLKGRRCRSFCSGCPRENRHDLWNLKSKNHHRRGVLLNTFSKARKWPLWAQFAGCEAPGHSFGRLPTKQSSAPSIATWCGSVRAIGPGSPWPWTPVDARLTCGVASSWSWPQLAMILMEAWTIASKSKTWGAKMGAEHAMTWTDAPHTGLHTYRFH